MTQPVTCVCLTTYPARASMLDDALLAYQLQTYPYRSMLIVNDGQPLRSLDANTYVLNLPPGQSIGTKRQLGLSQLGKTWLAVWDDDDFYMPGHLESMIRALNQHTATYVRTGVYAVTDEKLRVGCLVRRPPLASCVFWAPIGQKLGGYYDQNYGEDGSLYLRFLLKKYKHCVSPKLTFLHRRHTSNISSQYEKLVSDKNLHAKECVTNQLNWPDEQIYSLQTRVDQCLRMPRTPMIEPM